MMTEEKTYIQNDIERYVDLDKLDGKFNPYGRADALKIILPDSAEIYTKTTGGYQGTIAIIIELSGYIWVCNDGYGSCSYCDSFIESEKEWTEEILRKFYCFETVSDAIQYIHNTDDYWWEKLKDEVIEILEEESK